MELTLPKQHLSVSQINMYMRCPASYYYRYIEELIIPPSAALTRGKSVHSGIEFNYDQKMETFIDLPLKEVLEYTAAVFDESAEETDFGKHKRGKVKDETIGLSSVYHNEIAPAVQPQAVEAQVEVAFEDTDYTLLGYIDLVDQHKRIRDTKTAARSPNEKVLTDNLQLAAYSLMYRTQFEEEEAGVGLDYVVATKEPKVVQFSAVITEKDRQRFLKTMDMVAKAIKAQLFYPNSQNNWLCSPEHCGYWERCHRDW